MDCSVIVCTDNYINTLGQGIHYVIGIVNMGLNIIRSVPFTRVTNTMCAALMEQVSGL